MKKADVQKLVWEMILNEALPTKDIDPSKFPNPLGDAHGFLFKGKKDGDVSDDIVKTKPASISVKKLKPSQDAIYLGKALAMAVNGVKGGDLGAVISKDFYILDGHHRYAATTFNDPNATVSGVQASLKIGDLVPVLRAVGDAMHNKRGVAPKGGDINIFKATMDDVKKVIGGMGEKGKAWFDSIGEAEIAKRLKLLQSKKPPSGAPARKDMPKIEPGQVDLTANLLNKGKIDVRKPYAEGAEKLTKEGVMSELDLLAKEAKDFDSFVKTASKQLGMKPTGQTVKWLKTVFNNAKKNESLSEDKLTEAQLDKKIGRFDAGKARTISKHLDRYKVRHKVDGQGQIWVAEDDYDIVKSDLKLESINEAKDNLYLQLHKKYAEQIQGLKAKKIKKLTDLVSVQRWSMEDRKDYFDMDSKKKKELSAEYDKERKLFKKYTDGDYSVMLPKGTESLAESVNEARYHNYEGPPQVGDSISMSPGGVGSIRKIEGKWIYSSHAVGRNQSTWSPDKGSQKVWWPYQHKTNVAKLKLNKGKNTWVVDKKQKPLPFGTDLGKIIEGVNEADTLFNYQNAVKAKLVEKYGDEGNAIFEKIERTAWHKLDNAWRNGISPSKLIGVKESINEANESRTLQYAVEDALNKSGKDESEWYDEYDEWSTDTLDADDDDGQKYIAGVEKGLASNKVLKSVLKDMAVQKALGALKALYASAEMPSEIKFGSIEKEGSTGGPNKGQSYYVVHGKFDKSKSSNQFEQAVRDWGKKNKVNAYISVGDVVIEHMKDVVLKKAIAKFKKDFPSIKVR